jgi:hypothetical protein
MVQRLAQARVPPSPILSSLIEEEEEEGFRVFREKFRV